MFKNLALSFIILSSLNFYQFIFLGNSTKVLQLIAVGLIIGLYVMYSIYDSSLRIRKNFTLFIIVILFALPGSMFVASYYHDQPLGITAYEQRGMYFYLLYFLLPIMKPKPESVERLFFMFGVFYMVLYLIQYFLYPTVIFDTRVFEDRGTIRLGIPGTTYVLLSYFYSLQSILKQEKWYYVLYCLFAMAILVMLGGRQIIFFTSLMTVGILIFNQKLKSKIILFVLILMVFIPVYLLFKDVFNEIMAVSKEQRYEGVENVRIKAVLFFIKSIFPSDISYILGNGIPNNRSSYGQMMNLYSLSYGYHLSDIGIIGNYVTYGLLFVIGVITLLWKMLRIKIEEYYKYIKYFFIMILGLIFLGTGFQDSEFIVPLCLCLYLIDVSVMNQRLQSDEESDSEINQTILNDSYGDKPVYHNTGI